MKALSLWDPWATLMADGHKKVETRCWSTGYRGPLAIVSTRSRPSFLGKSRLLPEFEEEVRGLYARSVEAVCAEAAKGCVLAVADLLAIDEITPEHRETLTRRELLFGNYEEGRFAWFVSNLRKFKTPIPVTGHQGLWNWNAPENWEGLLI